MSEKTTVLIVSNPQDAHVSAVAQGIEQLGGKVAFFYPERLGKDVFLSVTTPANKQALGAHISSASMGLDLSDVYSIWYRRPRRIGYANEDISPKGAEFAADEWAATLAGVYTLLTAKLWVSHPNKLAEASEKLFQLSIAQQMGLEVPRTLVTNDPQQAKAFFYECAGKIIVKPIGRGWVYSEDETKVLHVETNRLRAQDLDAIEEIKTAPIMLQEEVRKSYEIRANVVGRKVLSIKIESQKSKISELDWRKYDIEHTPYLPYQLPADVEAKCVKVAARLGLEFGAIDMIRTPDGNYIFLEINGNGQYLWAERLSGVKVSDALARLLVGLAEPSATAETHSDFREKGGEKDDRGEGIPARTTAIPLLGKHRHLRGSRS